MPINEVVLIFFHLECKDIRLGQSESLSCSRLTPPLHPKNPDFHFSVEMAMSNFLSPTTPLRLSHRPFIHSSPFSLTHHSLLTLTHLSTNPVKPRRLLTTQSKGDDSVDVPDRLIAAVCYFYPFFDGIQYGTRTLVGM
ncbi:putative chloroplast protein import component Tic20 [Rosa chinensis]|uniref:Putative chloroplast protein import component Tic20 n=1 Tax=Rosa chinensis TaxID=74649 RepID=A0A2P6QFX4_ROSCH|nr:putative chloroplast protein import component Tic20 [Rosa chinensis]